MNKELKKLKDWKLKQEAAIGKEWCYCRATVDDDDANPLFMCSGDQRRCPGAGWFHPKCVGLKSVPKGNFYCQYCQTLPKPVKGR